MAVYRIFVEKKSEFAVEAHSLLHEIRNILLIDRITGVRIVNRYDVEDIEHSLFTSCVPIVFSEPPVDETYETLDVEGKTVFASEYLPGQFDARAASCEECIQLVSQGERPIVKTARVYILEGTPTDEDVRQIKQYVINPVESREAGLLPKSTLHQNFDTPDKVQILNGFIQMDEKKIEEFVSEFGLAMDKQDLLFCQEYFVSEKRDPSLTEIRMIDTYWSDHCRHTTFSTVLDEIEIAKPEVEAAFKRYLSLREELYVGKNKPITLMDIATIGTKALKSQGLLKNIDESEEINACSIEIDVDVNGVKEPWLLMFKNETHNHPTEIEPFGGAATCIGGAIRDPLSGRTYVYQAMRVTGAADPLLPVSKTMEGKLPQRKIVTTAAAGYSAYGNQIGLATGLVEEIYHPGYAAKRMEIGAVLGAAPKENVRRECPIPTDKIVLVGGRTGRDGCGGATGSSKSHKLESLETCGAEVQKGNPVVERKLQRLFRQKKVTSLIKRCNDFGAGGISVAIGELADGLEINLDLVPKKYAGLDGTELAISESQERMAVVVAKEDAERFIEYANEENLEATVVANVTGDNRLRMNWKNERIVDLSRTFLNSNGASKKANVGVEDSGISAISFEGNNLKEKMENMVSDLNICSKKGLSERFDSTIGSGTVLMPFGGKYQLTPTQAMVAKIPLAQGDTKTVSGMSYGFQPEIMSQSPYEGAYLSVVMSIAKLAATGFDTKGAYLTFQEYFERMTEDKNTWGKPFSALLGALSAQLDLGVAAIGGKDSMSGSFESLNVPPTLVSFAVAPGNVDTIISPELKSAGNKLCYLECDYKDIKKFKENVELLHKAIQEKKVVSAWNISLGGIAEGLFKMSLGNQIGVKLSTDRDVFAQSFVSFVLEVASDECIGELIGETTEKFEFELNNEVISIDSLQESYEGKLASVFPYQKEGEIVQTVSNIATEWAKPAIVNLKPTCFIPVFPGTNCEVDTAKALERAGAKANILLINNLSKENITQSIEQAAKMIAQSQMIVLPGGFSGGDEPEGSANFISAFFRNPLMKDSVHQLLKQRDGLILGICNGFQALVKLGLLPYGEIRDIDCDCPTLTFNTIGRHQSMLVKTRIASNKSPWLSKTSVGSEHMIAISHGEGRFVANDDCVLELIKNGQIATQYVDQYGSPTMDLCYNPNGSVLAIEGITNVDGRILGKMGHTERSGEHLYMNVPGDRYQPLFESGVAYFA